MLNLINYIALFIFSKYFIKLFSNKQISKTENFRIKQEVRQSKSIGIEKAIIEEKRQNNSISNKKLPNIYYINLDFDKERNTHVLDQLDGIEANKLYRINAIKHKWGAVGALQSHLNFLEAILKEDNNCDYAIVFEDDLIFINDKKVTNEYIQMLNTTSFEWDVIMLYQNTGASLNITIENQTIFKKVKKARSNLGYAIKKSYAPKLIKIWTELYYQTKDNIFKPWDRWGQEGQTLDSRWFELQQKDNWYVFDPPIITHSDELFKSNIRNQNSLSHKLTKLYAKLKKKS